MTEIASPVPFLIFHTVRQQIGMLIGFAGCGYALWRGGRPERIIGAAVLFGWTVCPFLINTNDWFDPQWAVAAVDVSLLALMLWVAFTSDRYWPMWAAAFHGLGVLMHATMLLDRRVPPWSYRTAEAVWSMLVLLALVAGTALEARRGMRPGPGVAARWRIGRLGRS
jgi:hypothetical protein